MPAQAFAHGTETPVQAVFLDRDGTIIYDRNYLIDPAGVSLLPGAAEGLARLYAAGYLLILVTNQSGIGRGYFTWDTLNAQHEQLRKLLAHEGVVFHDIRVCPHTPKDRCRCRKPCSGLLIDAAKEHGVELSASYMIGDKPADIQAGRTAGCRTIALGGIAQADMRAAGLAEAAELIQQKEPDSVA